MAKGRIRQVFPGGNTPQGFSSLYHYILPQEEATRIIVIKGGPGVGKSTFMRKIAMEMVDRGYDAEFMHCSSDNNSLDGIVIPAIKVAMLDGTAPHIVDPKNPGAVDEIIHLGDYWNEDGVRSNREAIMNDNREVGRFFQRAYKYLSAAKCFYDDSAVIHGWAADPGMINIIAKQLIDKTLGNIQVSKATGKQRHLFASAITPDGLKNYLNTILTTGTVFVIKGEQGMGCDIIMKKVFEASVERGFYTEAFHCPLEPANIDHIVIPAMDVSFTVSNDYHKFANANTAEEIDLKETVSRDILNKYSMNLYYNKQTFETLLNKTIETIGGAKKLHDRMETYYIPNMNFERVQIKWEETMERVLKYAEEFVK